MFFTCTRSLDEDLDDADDEEENTGFGVTQVNVLNSLDQVRGNVETVCEPFVLQKNSTVHVLWWKCKGFRVSCTAREEGLEVTVTVNPPTDEDLKDVGLDLPAAPLKSMSSKFFLGFGFRDPKHLQRRTKGRLSHRLHPEIWSHLSRRGVRLMKRWGEKKKDNKEKRKMVDRRQK